MSESYDVMTKARKGLAETKDTVVRIRRSVSEEPLDGFILARGRKWLLVSVVDGKSALDGYALVRSAHVTEMHDGGPIARFVRKYLDLHGEWPPRPPSFSLRLDRTADLVAALSDQDMAIAVYIEKEDPDVLFVGVPFVYKKRLGLREINSDGCWRDESSDWALSRITRIDFGDRYTTRLLEVAEHYSADQAAD